MVSDNKLLNEMQLSSNWGSLTHSVTAIRRPWQQLITWALVTQRVREEPGERESLEGRVKRAGESVTMRFEGRNLESKIVLMETTINAKFKETFQNRQSLLEKTNK